MGEVFLWLFGWVMWLEKLKDITMPPHDIIHFIGYLAIALIYIIFAYNS